MKYLQTIKGLNIEAGGLTTATYDLVTALNEIGCSTDLLTGGELMSRQGIIRQDTFVKVRPFENRTPIAYAPQMRDFLRQENDYALYHTNGLWVYVNHITCAIAREKHKPYVISPHGMLYPQALERSYWKKWLLLQLWFKQDLHSAACIHCTCKEEMIHCRELGLENPIAVIPNPVPIPHYIPDIVKNNEKDNLRFSRHRVGFIGRMHPRKRVERILQAWELYAERPNDAELVLIGVGEPDYVDSLKQYVHEHHLKNVIFTGQLDGENKFRELATLRCIFVPSDFENFGMIVPEALMVGTPVLASKGTPWQELESEHCGWWNDATSEDILAVMREIFADGAETELRKKGERGQLLVKNRYSSTAIAKKMAMLYEVIVSHTMDSIDFVHWHPNYITLG